MIRICNYLLLAITTSILISPAHTQKTPTGLAVLVQAREAAGGDHWNILDQITAEGHKTSFGLTGTMRFNDQLTTGFFTHEAAYSIFSNAEGLDRLGRWRIDNSGQIHPLNSKEATTVAVSESYIASRGYFFPERFPATVEECHRPPRPEYVCVAITPQGGRSMDTWINTNTYYVERIEMQLSVGFKSVEYADYRKVDDITLPFTIMETHGDESDSGTAHITLYRVMKEAHELARPQVPVSDAESNSGAVETTTRGYLDKSSGFFIIDASINGQGPYPFILDTGGHDILTPEIAHHLALTTIGKGFSSGAGPGSTQTEFTSVATISIGGAVMRKQPFTILHIDLGTAAGPKGRRVPIAGILGLEVFERFAVTMNYQADKVTLRPAEHFEYHGAGTAVPLQFTSDMPLCTASIDGHSGIFGIDTGNNTEVILFPVWARANGLDAGPQPGGMEGHSVGGDLKLATGHIKSFAIGGFDLGTMNVLFSSDTSGSLSARAEAGNVGNSILSRFNVTFAFRSGEIYLDRNDR